MKEKKIPQFDIEQYKQICSEYAKIIVAYSIGYHHDETFRDSMLEAGGVFQNAWSNGLHNGVNEKRLREIFDSELTKVRKLLD